MATFYSDSAFNINTLDFSAAMQGVYSTNTVAGGSLPLNLPPIAIGSATYQLPAHTFAFQSGIRVVVSGTSNGQVLAGDGFTYNADDELIGGTATVLATITQAHLDMGVAGFSISAVLVKDVAQTATTADDRSMFASIFTGNDLITTSAFNDTFDGGAGKDLIYDLGGGDSLAGGGGDDLIKGGTGADVIWAGTGSDTVAGGSGADVFLFKAGDGAASITDFNAADDQIVFMGPVSGIANLHMTQMGADLKITFADVTVILEHTLRSAVTLADIAIGGNAAIAASATAFFDGWDYAV